MRKPTIRELAESTERYDTERFWKEDLSDAIATGDIAKLEDAFLRGWDVNLPLYSFYFKEQKQIRSELDDYLEVHHIRVCDELHEIMFPMMWAVQKNCFESVDWLYRHGALFDVERYPLAESVEIQARHASITALQLLDEPEEMLRYIVKRKAKMKSGSIDGWLFMTCYFRGRMQLLPLILELGADIEAAMGGVLAAVRGKNLVALEQFLEAGFNINWHNGKGQNFSKNTAIGEAAQYGDVEMLQFLLAHGADVMIRNKEGLTPYELALLGKKPVNALLLRELCDPEGEGLKQALALLPQDILDYLQEDVRRLELGRDDIAYIDFLAKKDVASVRLARRNCVLLAMEVANYNTIWIVWNVTRKTVAYFDYEHEWYGEFRASFTEFITRIGEYITGILSGQYE